VVAQGDKVCAFLNGTFALMKEIKEPRTKTYELRISEADLKAAKYYCKRYNCDLHNLIASQAWGFFTCLGDSMRFLINWSVDEAERKTMPSTSCLSFMAKTLKRPSEWLLSQSLADGMSVLTGDIEQDLSGGEHANMSRDELEDMREQVDQFARGNRINSVRDSLGKTAWESMDIECFEKQAKESQELLVN